MPPSAPVDPKLSFSDAPKTQLVLTALLDYAYSVAVHRDHYGHV
ncbi:MAG: hypothetical protein OEY15_13960 [Myxococcales bacterium]|nr:hypothetical protein [Myxococcales bacterium]